MKALKRLFLLLIFMLANVAPGLFPSAHAAVVLNEQFNDINSLDGWTMVNGSTPAGLGWFQGNPGIFPAQQGAPNAYIAANYLSAQDGSGTISNWLITPQLTLLGPTTLSFYARAAEAAGFSDTLEIRFGIAGSFPFLLGTLGGDTPLTNSWQQFRAGFDYTGVGQFAFRYIGDAATSNYIGLDSVTVTGVPEPATWLLLVAGALTLLVWRGPRPLPSPPISH